MVDSVVKTRVAIGLTLIAVFSALLISDHVRDSALCFHLIVLGAVVFGLREFAVLATAAGSPVKAGPLMAFGGAVVLLPLLEQELGLRGLGELVPAVVIAWFFALVFPALRFQPSREVFRGLTAGLFGLVYIAVLASYVQKVRALPGHGVGEAAMLYTVVIAKGTDIFAFFAGKYLGRTKFIPHISPGKTVAGFVGGMAGALIITLAFVAWTPLGLCLEWRFAPAFAILLGLVVVAGDLVESLIKRSAEIKDSAKLLPAFGGVLDVIDSILAAAPFVYYGLVGLRRLSEVQAGL